MLSHFALRPVPAAMVVGRAATTAGSVSAAISARGHRHTCTRTVNGEANAVQIRGGQAESVAASRGVDDASSRVTQWQSTRWMHSGRHMQHGNSENCAAIKPRGYQHHASTMLPGQARENWQRRLASISPSTEHSDIQCEPQHQQYRSCFSLSYAPPPRDGYGSVGGLVALSRRGNCTLPMTIGYGRGLLARPKARSELARHTATAGSTADEHAANSFCSPVESAQGPRQRSSRMRRGGPHARDIPDSPPYEILVRHTEGLSPEAVRGIFAAHRPTDVKMFTPEHAYVLFARREDLLGALSLHQRTAGHRLLALQVSNRFRKIAAVAEGGPPFIAYLYRLQGMGEGRLLDLFKALRPTQCVVKQTSRGDEIAFMHFSCREDFVRAMDMSHSPLVNGVAVKPY
eukprot:scpid72292/ scgid29248/ 